jgi:hypothetical protein
MGGIARRIFKHGAFLIIGVGDVRTRRQKRPPEGWVVAARSDPNQAGVLDSLLKGIEQS